MSIFDWLKMLLTTCMVIDEALEDCIHDEALKEDLSEARRILDTTNKAVGKLQDAVERHELAQ